VSGLSVIEEDRVRMTPLPAAEEDEGKEPESDKPADTRDD
jgi:hypothetical protein